VVVASVAAPLGADATTLWTGADDGGVVRWVASRDDDRRAFLHPSATAFLSGHTRRVNALAHVPSAGDDSNPSSPASPGVVMSAGEDGVACAWRVDTGACVARRALGEDGCAIRSLALLRRRRDDDDDPHRDPSAPRDPSSPRASAATPPAVVAASCVFADGRAALALIDPATLAVVAAVEVSPRGDARTSDASGPSRRTSDSASASVVDAALAVVPIARDANDPANVRWPWDGDLAAAGADGVPRRLPRPKPGASLEARRGASGRDRLPPLARGGGAAAGSTRAREAANAESAARRVGWRTSGKGYEEEEEEGEGEEEQAFWDEETFLAADGSEGSPFSREAARKNTSRRSVVGASAKRTAAFAFDGSASATVRADGLRVDVAFRETRVTADGGVIVGWRHGASLEPPAGDAFVARRGVASFLRADDDAFSFFFPPKQKQKHPTPRIPRARRTESADFESLSSELGAAILRRVASASAFVFGDADERAGEASSREGGRGSSGSAARRPEANPKAPKREPSPRGGERKTNADPERGGGPRGGFLDATAG
jgi:hypothetical protein